MNEHTYTRKELKELFDGKQVSPYLDFSFEEGDDFNIIGNLSISGVQEKYSTLVEDGKIRLAHKGEQGTHILKPAPIAKISDRKEIPANEHLTMQLASEVYGLNTARNAVCFTADNQCVYITRRFDVQSDGRKYSQEDFSILTHLVGGKGGNFKYEGSYEDIAVAIKQNIASWPIAMDEFFRLVVFNYIFANGDAHLKNFSVLIQDGETSLSPAYDLINTAMHVGGDDLALKNGLSLRLEKSDVYEQTKHLCKTDFECFGKLIGMPSSRIKRTIERFSTFPQEVYDLIENSYLRTDKPKCKYIKIIEERRMRFIRESE